MLKQFFLTILILKLTIQFSNAATFTVNSVQALSSRLTSLVAGDTLLLDDGEYNNLSLIATKSGAFNQPIIIAAKNPGKVFITGDSKVELRGQYIIIKDLYFKNGSRNPNQWTTHGPGIIAIYNSYNRVTGCVFNNFDSVNSAYITTSLAADGSVPRYCRIDHCVFVGKRTLDQVINLNNGSEAIKDGSYSGPAMYHRIDHCYFSNPKKIGNAGGAIRIGYYRYDIGRCLVDSNLFQRQDSEPEIVTSKSQENVFYANTIVNSQGTLNFRHGDKQVALNNFFISTDDKYGYGGMFIWGSNHIIANNYFSLQKTISSRGNAALYFNPGVKESEHALAFNILAINNVFKDINGYSINFEPLIDRRRQDAIDLGLPFFVPYDINLKGNCFINTKPSSYTQFLGDITLQNFDNNYSLGFIPSIYGANLQSLGSVNSNLSDFYHPENIQGYVRSTVQNIENIQGIDLNIQTIINNGIKGVPLTWDNVRPSWLVEIPNDYWNTATDGASAEAKWLDEVNENKWSYNFSSGISSIYNTNGEAISPIFLPNPTSGKARVFIPNNSGSSFSLDVLNNKLEVFPNGTGATKFSIYRIERASEITILTSTFTLGKIGVNFPENNTSFILSIGYRGENNTIYSNSNSVFTSTNSGGNLFNAVRFLFNSTNSSYTVSYRTNGTISTGNYSFLEGGSLQIDIPYKIELCCNNSVLNKTYTRGVATYNVAPNSYHLWITDLSSGLSTRYTTIYGSYDIPKSQETEYTDGDLSIPTNRYLNSFLVQGTANLNGYAKLTIIGGMRFSYSSTTLPISLTSFTAQKEVNGIRLNWKTSSEMNNDYFELLRSTENINFNSITKVYGKGTSSELNTYSYLDNGAPQGLNYYKLKQVDKDGTSTLSDRIVAVNNSLKSEEVFSIRMIGDNQLKIVLDVDNIDNSIVKIIDISGKIVFYNRLSLKKGINEIYLEIPILNKGAYIATLTQNRNFKSIKIIK
jgi:chondroitin B lyase